MANIWEIDPKKKIPRLRGLNALYDFPFPNPYPTKNGVYTFAAGSPIVFYGAKNVNTEKIKWSLSSNSQDALIRKGEPEIPLSQDEFYLQMMLSGTGPAAFQISLTSVLDSGEYGVTFPVTIT